MIEVQAHGFKFEEWVKGACFGGYSGTYGQEWDVPAEYNSGNGIPEGLRTLPVSVKTSKYGSPVGLGDAIRQRGIDVPFVMIVGFWNQRTPAEKWIEEIGVAKFTVENWSALWGTLNMESLEEIDRSVKNLDLHYTEARKVAKNWKKEAIKNFGHTIVINPKIDSKQQRRIQCSLPFESFWKYAESIPERKDSPDLFGKEFKNPIPSPPRTFNQK